MCITNFQEENIQNKREIEVIRKDSKTKQKIARERFQPRKPENLKAIYWRVNSNSKKS